MRTAAPPLPSQVTMEGVLLLEDGVGFAGTSFGHPSTLVGEVVFNTSLTGYQEILSDPSYCGQIVVLTSPQIGNTGTNSRDMESRRPFVSGLIVADASPRVSSWRAEGSLESFLRAHEIPALTGVDTRTLTRHLRTRGVMKGCISTQGETRATSHQYLLDAPRMEGLDLVPRVSCTQSYVWREGSAKTVAPGEPLQGDGLRPRVVAVDFGIKYSILRCLVDMGFEVTVVPGTSSPDEILRHKPDGVFLSNGPGDPAAVTYAIQAVKSLLGRVPIFGICLGHQILALALGGHTYKLKFGHRGGNHPVRDLATGKVEITSHNHGFAVDDALPAGVSVTHINLNDHTVEGLESRAQGAFSIQYHPEAGPGPHDALHHFRRFRNLVDSWRPGGAYAQAK